MMMPVMGCPPERSLLHAKGAAQCEDELEHAAGTEGAGGEVTVITNGEKGHPQRVEADAGRHVHPTHAGTDCGKAHQVHGEKRDGPDERDFLVVRITRLKVQTVHLVPATDPRGQRTFLVKECHPTVSGAQISSIAPARLGILENREGSSGPNPMRRSRRHEIPFPMPARGVAALPPA